MIFDYAECHAHFIYYYAERDYGECLYAEGRYVECRCADCRGIICYHTRTPWSLNCWLNLELTKSKALCST